MFFLFLSEKPSLKVTEGKKKTGNWLFFLKTEMVTSIADVIQGLIKVLLIVVSHRHGTIDLVACLWLIRLCHDPPCIP